MSNAPRYYVVRNDSSDSWQLCGLAGMPVMAPSRVAGKVVDTVSFLLKNRAKGLAFPLPVFHVVSDSIPAKWDGEFTANGEWVRV